MRARARSLALVASAALAAAGNAHAQALNDATAAARRELIAQAQQARDQGNHAEALDLAGRAGRLQMSPSLRRFIAEEQSALGQLSAALHSALLCVGEAQHDRTPGRNSRPHAVACQSLADSLRPRVGRVLVRVASPAPPGLHISVAGEELPEALWGVPYDVDPGVVVVEAHTGMRNLRREVQVAGGDVEPVNVSFAANSTPSIEAAHPAPPARPAETAQGGTAPQGVTTPQGGQPTSTASARTTQPTPSGQPAQSGGRNGEPTRAARVEAPVQPLAPEPAPESSHSVAPFVVLGGAVVSFIAAGAFYAVRNGYDAQWRGMCPTQDGVPYNCPESARPAYNNEVTWNAATNVALVVGGVALAGGVAWLLVDRLGSGPAAHAAASRARRPTALIAPSPGGVTLGILGVF